MNFRVLLGQVCFLGLLTALPLAAQPGPVGTWIGRWERDGSRLEVEVVFARTDAGYAGAFSSRQLRVVAFPFREVRFVGPTVSWNLVGDATTTAFEGTVQGDTLEGRFHEGDAGGT